jgi:hypothetical protein
VRIARNRLFIARPEYRHAEAVRENLKACCRASHMPEENKTWR